MKFFKNPTAEMGTDQRAVHAGAIAVNTTAGLTRRIVLGGVAALALVLTAFASGSSPADAAATATPGSWTGWTLNSATGCQTAAQTPFLNASGQAVTNLAVYCPRDTWLTVRGRIRSDRTLSPDVTVATTGCWATSTCPALQPAGTRYYFAACSRNSSTVRHGYHSDIIIYPGTQSLKATGSTSGATTFTAHCFA